MVAHPVSRAEWIGACAAARRGGRITPTLANLVAAYRCVQGRTVFPSDPFAEGVWHG